MAYRSHTSSFRLYFLIALICGLSALCMELFSQGTRQFRSYAEQRLDEAVRKAVRTEVQELTVRTPGRTSLVQHEE